MKLTNFVFIPFIVLFCILVTSIVSTICTYVCICKCILGIIKLWGNYKVVDLTNFTVKIHRDTLKTIQRFLMCVTFHMCTVLLHICNTQLITCFCFIVLQLLEQMVATTNIHSMLMVTAIGMPTASSCRWRMYKQLDYSTACVQWIILYCKSQSWSYNIMIMKVFSKSVIFCKVVYCIYCYIK